MLRAEALFFRYTKGPWILDDTEITVAPGEVVGLPGASGRGKSTLARLLCGYLLPKAGSIVVDGSSLPLRGYCPVQLIFQHPEMAMNPRWKVAKTLQEAQDSNNDILGSLGIHPQWLQRYPHELSGGELQRIALARVMTDRTRYIVADEMTAMLDANTQAMIWNVMLQWARKRAVGILVISHDHHLLRRITDRIDDQFLT